MFVVVEDLPPELVKSGVSEDQVKAVVEEELRGAGIKALSMAEYLRTPNLPFFSGYISAVHRQIRAYPCNIYRGI